MNGSAANGRPPDVQRQVSTLSHGPSPSCLQTLFSWRSAMALHMHVSLVLLVMLSMNMPFALVCMLKPAAEGSLLPVIPANASFSDGNISSLADETNFFSSNASLFAGNASFSEGNTSSLADNQFYNDSWLSTTGPPVDGRGGEDDASAFGRNATDSDGPGTGEFTWDSSTQGLLLSASWFLAFLMPMLVDSLSRRFGGKRLILVFMLSISCLSLLQPEGARLSPYVLFALRLFVGFIGGAKFPLLSEVFSWWAPASEKVTMVSLAMSGMNTASILVSLTSGYLCSIPIDKGWPFIFYVQGSLTVLWCITWQLTGSLKPEDHPYISEEEKQYIVSTRLAMDKTQKRSTPPYRQILTSVPVWGCLIVQASHAYSFVIISSYTPLYLNGFLGFDLETVGVISAVSYGMRFLGVVGWGQLSNLLLWKAGFQTTTCRKVVQCGGFYMTVACLVALGFVSDPMLCAGILCAALLSQSATSASSFLVPLDMAPRFAGFLTGFNIAVNSMLTMPGPLITSAMVKNNTMEEWRSVFLYLAAIVFVGSTCFLFMASSKLQSWALPQTKKYKPQSVSADGSKRKMSVLSFGTPGSPVWNQKRFSFFVEAPKFSEAKLEISGTFTAVERFAAVTSTANMDNDLMPASVTESTETTSTQGNAQDSSCSDVTAASPVDRTIEESPGTGAPGSSDVNPVSSLPNGTGYVNRGFDHKSETRL